MKDKIYDLIKTRRHVSFAELSQIDGFKGDLSFGFSENLLLWTGMSEEAVEAMSDLMKTKKITPDSNGTTLMCYFADGAALSLPVAKSLKREYKKPHWVPTTWNVT